MLVARRSRPTIGWQPAIKWSYPEIIHATDLLQALLQGEAGEETLRRNVAVKAYVAGQYRDDEEVKFQQIELQNKIVDLFVDIPATPIASAGGARRWQKRTSQAFSETWVFEEIETLEDGYLPHQFVRQGRASVGAAKIFLNWEQRRRVDRVVLEGAPGQGKSTITQFACQVYRLQLLQKAYELGRVNPEYRQGPTRLPMRVDLRDFAVWLGGKNPFASDKAWPEGAVASLEGFLAHQIVTGSGGFPFGVADLTAVARTAHLFVVLDGFDEVADIPTRKLVVDEISRAASRLEAVVPAALIVVTSRPAAFRSPLDFPNANGIISTPSMSPQQIQNMPASGCLRGD